MNRRTAAAVLAAVAAITWTGCGQDSASQPSPQDPPGGSTTVDHAHMDMGDGHAMGPAPGEVTAGLTAAGYQEAGQQGTWDYLGTDRPRLAGFDAATLPQRVRDAVAGHGWDRLEVAQGDGFARLSNLVDPVHFFNQANLDDGIMGDPERPESLLYDPASGQLLGVMFLAPIGTHGPELDGAPDARWHAHAGSYCYRSDRMLPWSVPNGTTCPDGQTFGLWTSEMIHVWLTGGDDFNSKMPDVVAKALEDANSAPSGK